MNWFNNLFVNKPRKIFLDYAAATPVLSEVKRAMEKYWSDNFYNPNAIYEEGLRVGSEVQEYRTKVARIAGVSKDSVIFTSGGTESNTWAIQGVDSPAGGGHLIIDAGSHPSVLDAAKGRSVSMWQAEEELPIKKVTSLVSISIFNNKVGRKIREWRKVHNTSLPLLHIDASQGANYFDIKLETLACDILSLDAAKLYGPKGIGALIVRRGVHLALPPQGTPPVPLVAGFARALEIAVRDKESERTRLSSLSVRFAEGIRQGVPRALVDIMEPNIVHVSVPEIMPEFMVLALDQRGVKVSAGPACNSNKPEPSETPVRFSFGRFTTKKDIDEAIEIFCLTVASMIK